MGICNYASSKFDSFLSDLDISKVDLIELGDQEVVGSNGALDPNSKFRNIHKEKFKSWRTFDLHDVEGVENFDLSVVSPFRNCADVITNFGTSEHVEPEIGQYNCWVNQHNLLRVGGKSLHIITYPGYWEGHSRYYHDFDFFKNFENYGYDILELSVTYNNLVLCILKKVEDKEFMSYDEFVSKITFVETSNDIIHYKNNPKNLKW